MRLKQGKLRGEKIIYKDGIGCCVWYPLYDVENSTEEQEDSGICFDFSYNDIDDFISLLQQLKVSKPTIYKEDS